MSTTFSNISMAFAGFSLLKSSPSTMNDYMYIVRLAMLESSGHKSHTVERILDLNQLVISVFLVFLFISAIGSVVVVTIRPIVILVFFIVTHPSSSLAPNASERFLWKASEHPDQLDAGELRNVMESETGRLLQARDDSRYTASEVNTCTHTNKLPHLQTLYK